MDSMLLLSPPSHLAVQARGSYFALPDTAEVASHYKNAFCGPLCILGFLRLLFFSWYLHNLKLKVPMYRN